MFSIAKQSLVLLNAGRCLVWLNFCLVSVNMVVGRVSSVYAAHHRARVKENTLHLCKPSERPKTGFAASVAHFPALAGFVAFTGLFVALVGRFSCPCPRVAGQRSSGRRVGFGCRVGSGLGQRNALRGAGLAWVGAGGACVRDRRTNVRVCHVLARLIITH